LTGFYRINNKAPVRGLRCGRGEGGKRRKEEEENCV